jgi:hypothetical protein
MVEVLFLPIALYMLFTVSLVQKANQLIRRENG